VAEAPLTKSRMFVKEYLIHLYIVFSFSSIHSSII
jgi:hypothetical protein